MITVYVPMQSDPFVNAFICFCSRHLGIRYVLEFGPPLLHLHFISSLDFFLWMCGISNLYLSLKVFLWLLLFVKKVQYTYKTKPPENLFCEIKLHKAEWLTESAEGRLNCEKKLENSVQQTSNVANIHLLVVIRFSWWCFRSSLSVWQCFDWKISVSLLSTISCFEFSCATFGFNEAYM